MGKGWKNESARHSLAARGLKTKLRKVKIPVKSTIDHFENFEETLHTMGNEASIDFNHHSHDVYIGWDKITREHIYKFEGMLEGIWYDSGFPSVADQKKAVDLIFAEAEKINDFRETVGLGRMKVMYASTRGEMEAEDAAERAFSSQHEV